MSVRITVWNRQRAIVVDLAALKRFAPCALTLCEALPPKMSACLTTLPKIAIHLVSDRRIAQLHAQFLAVEGPTDVITFQHGEIFMGVATAQRQAAEYSSSLSAELQLYLVHGLLHLHGYDDRTARGAREMERLQTRVLRTLGLRPSV